MMNISLSTIKYTSPPHHLRYEFISYSDSYDDYLLALGTPGWVLGLAKASSERITVSSRGEGDRVKWHFKTGRIRTAFSLHFRNLL